MAVSAPEHSSYLAVQGVSKRFKGVSVLEALDLAVSRGEFISLLGPSGCGKTTLLRLIAGLLRSDGGTILLEGENLTRLPAHRRQVGVVFQNYALFPHLSVAENVAFGLRAVRRPEADIQQTVARNLALVHMQDFAERPVLALSGGQQQRVAVARALAVQPRLLLLDEPFSALDRKLRETMQIELRRLLRELNITAVFVTHDQDEALIMSDRIAVMNQGRIEQFADPTRIYTHPASAFVLDFVGSASRFDGTVQESHGDVLTVACEGAELRAPGHFQRGRPVRVAVRPEAIHLGEAPAEGYNQLSVVLRDRVFMGSRMLLYFDTPGNDVLLAELSPARVGSVQPGEALTLHWAIADTLVFPP